MTTEFEVMLTPEQLFSVASVAVAAPKNDVTPVIQSVRVSVADGFIIGVATDRYRVARVRLALHADAPSVEDFEGVTIQRSQIEQFAKVVKASKPTAYLPTVKLAVGERDEAGLRTVTLSEYTSGAQSVQPERGGNFPPVARLFPKDESGFGPQEVLSLNIGFLADVGKLVHPSLGRGETPRFRFTKTENPHKPGPVLIDYPNIRPEDGSLEYLLQPNLLKR